MEPGNQNQCGPLSSSLAGRREISAQKLEELWVLDRGGLEIFLNGRESASGAGKDEDAEERDDG